MPFACIRRSCTMTATVSSLFGQFPGSPTAGRFHRRIQVARALSKFGRHWGRHGRAERTPATDTGFSQGSFPIIVLHCSSFFDDRQPGGLQRSLATVRLLSSPCFMLLSLAMSKKSMESIWPLCIRCAWFKSFVHLKYRIKSWHRSEKKPLQTAVIPWSHDKKRLKLRVSELDTVFIYLVLKDYYGRIDKLGTFERGSFLIPIFFNSSFWLAMAMINILTKYGPRPITLRHLTWRCVSFQIVRTLGSEDGVVRDEGADAVQVRLSHEQLTDCRARDHSWR